MLGRGTMRMGGQMNEDHVTINGVKCQISDLPEKAQEILKRLRFIDEKIAEFESEINVFKLARSGFMEDLKKHLPSDLIQTEAEASAREHPRQPREAVELGFADDFLSGFLGDE